MRFLPWLALSLPSIQRESSLHARAPSPALMRRKSVERANFISPKLCTKEASAARRGSGKGRSRADLRQPGLRLNLAAAAARMLDGQRFDPALRLAYGRSRSWERRGRPDRRDAGRLQST